MDKYGLKLYEFEENVVDCEIFKEDEITFSVLKRIVNAKSNKVFTDGERIIICHSTSPFPVWIWTKADVTTEELKRIANCLCEEFPLTNGFTYNISYELLDKLKAVDERLCDYEIETNLLSFRCDDIKEINKKCDGKPRLAIQEDMDILWKCMYEFSLEAQGLEFSEEYCRQSIQVKIDCGGLYVWENGAGEIVAVTNKRIDEKNVCLSLVYTLPFARRSGYALNLVHKLTGDIIEEGKLPILYTDADYVASNACYKKVGFREVGSLCTVKYKEGK